MTSIKHENHSSHLGCSQHRRSPEPWSATAPLCYAAGRWDENKTKNHLASGIDQRNVLRPKDSCREPRRSFPGRLARSVPFFRAYSWSCCSGRFRGSSTCISASNGETVCHYDQKVARAAGCSRNAENAIKKMYIQEQKRGFSWRCCESEREDAAVQVQWVKPHRACPRCLVGARKSGRSCLCLANKTGTAAERFTALGHEAVIGARGKEHPHQGSFGSGEAASKKNGHRH